MEVVRPRTYQYSVDHVIMSQVYGRATQTYKGKKHIFFFFRETWDNIISEEPFINEKGKIRYTPEQKDNEDYKNTLQVALNDQD